MIIEEIPDEIDVEQSWLVEYWAEKLSVSPDAIRHAVASVGSKAGAVKKKLKDGYRLSIVDDQNTDRVVARIKPHDGGFSVSVPYHPARDGMIIKVPLDYSKKEFAVPFDKANTFKVSRLVKLSFHMDGFVQFSSADKKPIVSGYNKELGQVKGVGLKSDQDIIVRSGPLCGIKLQGLHEFTARRNKPAESFVPSDFWHHPKFSRASDTAINIEFFLLGPKGIRRSSLKDGKRILRTGLPFNGEFQFEFDLRVLEFPNSPFGLGVIVSNMPPSEGQKSCYSLGGPGCFDEHGTPYGIGAWYPIPERMKETIQASLDHETGSDGNGEAGESKG